MNPNLAKPMVLVTGGGGYVGSVLVPKLLKKGYKVRVLDVFFYGQQLKEAVGNNPQCEIFEGDIRDRDLVAKALEGVQAVIHLACISNDPSSDLDPKFTQTINYDAVVDLVGFCQKQGVSRFINASTSSVYGIRNEPEVSEDLALEPLTLYAKLKAETEKIIREANSSRLTSVSIRSATVCGWSPRLRLDLTVNILTASAICKGMITVFGGTQRRPNIHIEDITDLYAALLETPKEKIAGRVFNAGAQNHTLMEIAELVRQALGREISIKVEPTDDLRSYHISSKKIKEELGFEPRRSILNAIEDLQKAFKEGRVPKAMEDIHYYNVKVLKEVYHARAQKSATAR